MSPPLWDTCTLNINFICYSLFRLVISFLSEALQDVDIPRLAGCALADLAGIVQGCSSWTFTYATCGVECRLGRPCWGSLHSGAFAVLFGSGCVEHAVVGTLTQLTGWVPNQSKLAFSQGRCWCVTLAKHEGRVIILADFGHLIRWILTWAFTDVGCWNVDKELFVRVC